MLSIRNTVWLVPSGSASIEGDTSCEHLDASNTSIIISYVSNISNTGRKRHAMWIWLNKGGKGFWVGVKGVSFPTDHKNPYGQPTSWMVCTWIRGCRSHVASQVECLSDWMSLRFNVSQIQCPSVSKVSVPMVLVSSHLDGFLWSMRMDTHVASQIECPSDLTPSFLNLFIEQAVAHKVLLIPWSPRRTRIPLDSTWRARVMVEYGCWTWLVQC